MTSLAVRFVLDWNYAAKENLFLEDSLFEIPKYIRHGRDPVQIISSGRIHRSRRSTTIICGSSTVRKTMCISRPRISSRMIPSWMR